MTEAQQALIDATAEEIIAEFLTPIVIAGIKASGFYPTLRDHLGLKLLRLHGALKAADDNARLRMANEHSAT